MDSLPEQMLAMPFLGPIDTYSLYVTLFHPGIINTLRYFADRYGLTREIQWYPHLTIFKYFWPRPLFSEEQLLKTIATAASPFDCLPIGIDGLLRLREWSAADQTIVYRVVPSVAFHRFYTSLSERLFHYSLFPPSLPLVQADTRSDLHPEEKMLHITIAWHLRREKADAIWEDLNGDASIDPIREEAAILRVTLGKNNGEYAQYDFPRRFWLQGEAIYSESEQEKTEESYRRIRRVRGFESRPDLIR